jgi:acetolactate synthase-1/2/3 large subunit
VVITSNQKLETASKPSSPCSAPSQPTSGADIVVQTLVNHGVDTVFAYPGGASMPIHQALTRFRDQIRVILPRHEQGGGFAAQGYARTTGKVGVCMTTSGPGATNVVTALADAKLDSIPLLAITGQVSASVIGTDAFQETPIVEVCRSVTKHHYLVTDVNDIARVVREAFYIATTGRPGPVLIDIPKNIQFLQAVPDYNAPMKLPGYRVGNERATPKEIETLAEMIRAAKRPVIYAGGGVISSNASKELITLVEKTGIPITTTIMGLGGFPGDHPLALDMLGMHGSVYANYAVDNCDLLIALGVRFDDRVTGKVSEFATHGKIVHVDNDPSEIHKNKVAHIPIVADLRETLAALNAAVTDDDLPEIDEWWRTINAWRDKHPLRYAQPADDQIIPQYAIEELHRQTADRDTYVSVGVGQHQMWAAQYYRFDRPRRWMSSSGLGAMGFGLPAAMGAQAAHPESLVVDIDGDGSLLMNIQELATLHCEKLPVKVFLLNNQHLGMVMQWEDRFHESNRAHTYLGPVDHPEARGKGTGPIERTYPDFTAIAAGFGVPGRQVRNRKEFPEALAEMLSTSGPYVLDIVCPYQEHVLPMIPGGRTVKDIILE